MIPGQLVEQLASAAMTVLTWDARRQETP